MLPAAGFVSSDSLTGTARMIVPHRCIVVAIRAINLTAADAFVQFFDAVSASDVVVGSTTPTWVVQSDPSHPTVGDGLPNSGIVFENGIVAASTTTATGSVGASQHLRLGVV